LFWEDKKEKAVIQIVQPRVPANTQGYGRRHGENPICRRLLNALEETQRLWERNILSIDIFSRDRFLQKLNYIHRNPVHERWRLSTLPEGYHYSSALFYESGVDNFGFLTHWVD
jgi:hypothetical protein